MSECYVKTWSCCLVGHWVPGASSRVSQGPLSGRWAIQRPHCYPRGLTQSLAARSMGSLRCSLLEAWWASKDGALPHSGTGTGTWEGRVYSSNPLPIQFWGAPLSFRVSYFCFFYPARVELVRGRGEGFYLPVILVSCSKIETVQNPLWRGHLES